MNRERILFLAVVAILGLWFLLREPAKPETKAEPQVKALVRRPVLSPEYTPTVLTQEGRPYPIWDLVTNVRPHPRPVDALERPKPFDLPNIWPPTSRCVSTENLQLLRRDAAAPQAGAAAVQLPAQPGAEGGGAAGASTEKRVDTWKSNNSAQKGIVTEIVAGGSVLKEPPRPWPYGKAVLQPQWRFLTLLRWLEDPSQATQEGVTGVHASAGRMNFRQDFPSEINSFSIAVDGEQKGYFDGLRLYLAVQGGQAADPRLRSGEQLLEDGLKLPSTAKTSREDMFRWALALLEEAYELFPKGAQAQRRQALLAMLRAAGQVNDHEKVLELALRHLDQDPGEPEVLEYVGDVLDTRTFSLAPFAIEFYELASDRGSAQKSLIATLVKEGRFREAQEKIAKGRAGTPGAEQDLLKARVALALGDFANATTFADRHASDAPAEAHQILGGIAYAKGDAATAAQEFEKAAQADAASRSRSTYDQSTVYSDWGLALAVDGKTEDALACFARALELDSIDNAVAPELGRAYLKLAAGEAALRGAADAEDTARRDSKVKKEKEEEATGLRGTAKDAFAAAVDMLAKLQDNNPNNLLVRFILGYAKERTGSLEDAADLYRSTIDTDPRYRVAIARLGLVLAQRVLGGGPKDLSRAAIAHLSKAVDLSPDEAVLPYVLARFLMVVDENPGLADEMFERAGKLEPSDRNRDLPLWADLGRACLAYADEKQDPTEAMKLLNALRERIREKKPGGTTEQKLMENEVYRAATIDLQIIEDNEKKVDRIWDFTPLTSAPADWEADSKSPMEIRFEPPEGCLFAGKINYEGRGRENIKTVLDACSIHYPKGKDGFPGGTFWELEVTGVTPAVGPDSEAELAIAILNPLRNDQAPGVSVKRKRTGNMEVRVDGGDRQVFKDAKDRWVELQKVPWPEGEFHLKFDVVPEYGLAKRRALGRLRIFLNGEEVFQKQFEDQPGERANIVSLSRSSTPVQVWLWAEGRDGYEIKGIEVKSVTLTTETTK